MTPILLKNIASHIYWTISFSLKDNLKDPAKWTVRKFPSPRRNRDYNEFVEWVRVNNKFYQDLSDEEWRDLRLTKSILNNSSEYLCNEAFGSDIRVNSSGGSTGEKAYFKQPRDFRDAVSGCYQSFLKDVGLKAWNRKELLLWGAPADLEKNVFPKYPKLYLAFNNTLVVDATDLSVSNLNTVAKLLETEKFDIIRGYAGALELLARVLNSRNIIAHSKIVISTASKLTRDSYAEITSAFTGHVIDFYGSREVGPIGFINENREFKYFPSFNHIEIDPIQNTDGINRLYVTNLVNRVMPLVKYDIGDLVKTNMNSEIVEIIGRKSVLFTLSDGRYADATGLNHLLNGFGILRFQIIQRTKDLVEIIYESTEPLQFDQVRLIEARFKSRLGENVEIRITRTEQIKVSPSGKFQYFISEVSND